MSLPFNNKKDQLQFINCVIGIHDLCCHCPNPLFHSTKLLLKQLAPELQAPEKQQLQQCLGDAATTKEDADTGIDFGDLEKLFGDDEEEEDTSTDNR